MHKNYPVEFKFAVILIFLLTTLGLVGFANFVRYKVRLSESVSAMHASVRNSESGNFVSAIAFGRKSVEYCPDGFWGHLYLGMALSQAGNYTQSISELQIANKMSETNEGNLYLAKSLFAVGRAYEANSFLKKAEEGNEPLIAAQAQSIRLQHLRK